MPSTSEQRSPDRRVRQHRHDAVGEIGRVAAATRLAVEGGAGADVVGDVGDRDPDDVAAGVRRVLVGLGEDGVVVVAGVGGVDGDEGQRAQVLAPAEAADRLAASASARASSGKASGMPCSWIAISDTAFGGRGVAEAGDDAGARQAVAAGRPDLLGLDQLAIAGAGAVGGADQPVAVGALVDRGDPSAALALVVDAEDAARAHADAADDPRGERVAVGEHAAEQPVAGAERRVVAAGCGRGCAGRGRRPPSRRARPRGRRRRRRR